MQGWRKKMEDADLTELNIGTNKSIDLFGVFDGHGGIEISQFVKKHFTQEFLKNPSYISGNIKQALIETFLKMDELLKAKESKSELFQYAKQSKEEESTYNNEQQNQFNQIRKITNPNDQEDDCDIAMITGCTACVCAIDHSKRKIYYANAGDSRVVICKNKIAHQMSKDHKADIEAEKNRILKAEGWINEGRILGNLNMSRSIGDLEYKQKKNFKPEEQMITAYPEVIEENITDACEFIILGCYGIWDCMTNQEACDYIKSKLEDEKPLSKIIEELMDSILAEDIYNGNLSLLSLFI